jgi:4a-hydroxytetrahydrobiopterin dehydratase
MTSELSRKHCVPCEGGMAPLGAEEARALAGRIEGWDLKGDRLSKRFHFKDFVEAMAFVNGLAELAEAEGHHPDIHIQYNKVRLELWTHAAKGLTENDFILAAKIDVLRENR